MYTLKDKYYALRPIVLVFYKSWNVYNLKNVNNTKTFINW